MNRYFYIDSEGKQKGTFSPEELRQENIRKETLVWAQGMEQWKRADEVSELQFLFMGTVQSAASETANADTPVQSYSQQPVSSAPAQPMPKTWLVESILATILPFILCSSLLSLLGIIGIVYAAQVESFYNRGDYSGAEEASRSAAKWTKIALWIAIGWILLIIMAIILMIVFFGSLTDFSELGDRLSAQYY